MPRDPWGRRSRRLVYENDWIALHHDEVTRPDGTPGIYGVVHFKTLAVGVVALDPDDRVLLVGQWRYTLDRYSWEIVEGGAVFDEDPLEGARRELREETGYTARTWREIGRSHLSNSVTDEAGVLFLATDLVPGRAEPDGTEELAIRWVPFAEALAMADRAEISDLLTQAALDRVARMRASGAVAGSGGPS